MAAEAVFLVVTVFVAHGAHSSIPPKFIKASYGVQKALYAKNFGYSLIPIPTYIQRQAHPPKHLPVVGHVPVLTARKGRGYKYYNLRGPPRRRKRPPVRRRRPTFPYGVPTYATKYKNYTSYRRPPSKPGRYKKRRPYRPPVRRPIPYVNVHHDIDEYEQDIPDDYDEYDSGDREEYSYIDIPSKRLPLQHDKDLFNRHADLYKGYYSRLSRERPGDSFGDYTLHRVRSRIRYQTNKEEIPEQEEKGNQESQEALWPGEVSNADPQSWHDQTTGQSEEQHWQHPQGASWYDVNSGNLKKNNWPQAVRKLPPTGWHNRMNDQQSPHEWLNHQRPMRFDNKWDVHLPQAQQWTPRPTSTYDLPEWSTPFRPQPTRGHEQSNQQPGYGWESTSQRYQEALPENRPRYQSHYSEAEFTLRDSADRKMTDNHRNHKTSSELDIGFGEGLEVVDDGALGK